MAHRTKRNNIEDNIPLVNLASGYKIYESFSKGEIKEYGYYTLLYYGLRKQSEMPNSGVEKFNLHKLDQIVSYMIVKHIGISISFKCQSDREKIPAIHFKLSKTFSTFFQY